MSLKNENKGPRLLEEGRLVLLKISKFPATVKNLYKTATTK